jgi:hypothetical protein
MIFPWHTDLFQPGRTVCVVIRASPLIWPTSSGAHHAPRPLIKVHPRWFSTRGYGCWWATTKALSSRTAKPIRDLVPQSPRGSPLCAIASARMTGMEMKVTPRSGFSLVPQAPTQRADQIHHCFANHRTGQINRTCAHLLEDGHVVGWDDAADDDHDVAAALG